MIYGNWLAKWAQINPEKTALIDLETDRVFPYRALNTRADRVAHLLRERFGVGRGDRVAVLGANRVEQVELFFGLCKLGAVLVPANWRLAASEVAYVLGDCAPRLLVFGRDVAATVDALPKAGWDGQTLAFDGQDPDGYPALVEAADAAPVETPGLDGDSPALMLYTSGTTGRPKGAVQTHGVLTWNAVNTAASWDLHHNDVTLTHTPFFHTGGWGVLTLPLLHRGATVVVARRFDPEQTLAAVGRHQISVLFAVPTMFQMMLDSPGMASATFDSVRFFVSGGAPCPIPLIEQYAERGVAFNQGYGLTEVGPNCFVLHPRDAVTKVGSVGFPVLHLDTRIVDAEKRPVAPGQVGELQLRGPTVCAGYWNNPKATAAAMDADGWFATGDLFRVDEDGFHYVVGRLKEMFISGGENVYPAEVERVLYEVPAVVEAAVVGIPDPKWGEVGRAFVALDPEAGPEVTAESILAHCRAELAKYKVPKDLRILESLPKGPSGKILKKELTSVEDGP